MNFRLGLGLVLAGSLAFGSAACASGGGGTGGATATPSVEGEEVPQGERPRQNDMTDRAADNLEDAEEILDAAREEGTDMAAAEAEARPFFEAALEAAQQAIAADSTNPLPYLQAGYAHIGLGNYVEADRVLARAEELRPVYTFQIEPLRERTWIDLFNEAQPALDASDYEEAARIFEQADVMYQGRPEVKIVLGQIYSALGRNAQAAELFRAAMDIIETESTAEMDSATAAQWQEHAETLPLAIADALIAAEEYDEAAVQLRGLLEEDPESVVLARNLASVFIRLEQPDSAAMIYDELLARPSLTGSDYYQIGVGLYNMESYDEAAGAFSSAVEAATYNRDAAEMWARSLQLDMSQMPEGEEPSEAQIQALQEAAETWLELDPRSRNAHLIAAQAANTMGDQDRARELVTAIEEMPISLDNLQMQAPAAGGATVMGQLVNLNAQAGTQVTVEFTFYGPMDEAIGTETTMLQLPAQEASQALRVDFQSEERVTGYSYTVEGLGQ